MSGTSESLKKSWVTRKRKERLYCGPIIDIESAQAKVWPEIANTCCFLGGNIDYLRKEWEKVNGPRPIYEELNKKMLLCHKCDNINGFCCNLAHIFLGKDKENNQDRKIKQRSGSDLKKSWETRKFQGKTRGSALKGWETRRKLGTDITGALKQSKTKKESGIGKIAVEKGWITRKSRKSKNVET